MRQLFIFLCLIFFLCSCSSTSDEAKTEAERLYKEATELVENERFILATEKLNQIKTQHPYSYYATPAELMLAEVLYKQDNFVESAAAFLLFRDFHPKHEKIAYIIYMIGESYFRQLPSSIDRDLESGIEALKYFKEYLQKYSQEADSKEVRERVEKIEDMLREKDSYVADFYFRTEVWGASRWWYLDILERHAANAQLRNQALLRVVIASAKLKEWEKCLIYAEKFFPLLANEWHEEFKKYESQCQSHKK